MASPEFQEGQKPLVERKTEFAEVPENLRDSMTSVDVQKTPTLAVEHEGGHLVKPTINEYEIPYSQKEIERMRGGSVSDSSTWLGTFLTRIAKIMESVGKIVRFSRGTA